MNKLDKVEKIFTRADIVLCLFTMVVSFVFPFIVNKESFRVLFSSGFMYWMLIISSVIALIAIVLFVVVLVIRTIHHKKIIIDKSIVFTHIINLVFIASLIFFIYDYDLGFIFA